MVVVSESKKRDAACCDRIPSSSEGLRAGTPAGSEPLDGDAAGSRCCRQSRHRLGSESLVIRTPASATFGPRIAVVDVADDTTANHSTQNRADYGASGRTAC